jgi:large subunit ribosomal protein L28
VQTRPDRWFRVYASPVRRTPLQPESKVLHFANEVHALEDCGSTKQFRIGSKAMAQVCDICGKGPQFGNNISHAHNVTRRRWNVNLQAVKALVNGAPKRIRVCTSCIKSGKIAKA